MRNYHLWEQGVGNLILIPIKIASIEAALDMATCRLEIYTLFASIYSYYYNSVATAAVAIVFINIRMHCLTLGLILHVGLSPVSIQTQ